MGVNFHPDSNSNKNSPCDQDQHMITLLSRTDNPNRTILVTLDRGLRDVNTQKSPEIVLLNTLN